MTNRILIIDDDPAIGQMLSDFLTGLGYETRTAGGGPEALGRITTEPFDLALCDVLMPGMDGLAVLAEIRKCRPELPVVMMSGFATHDRIINTIENGANDFIAKPVNFAQARQIIGAVLNPELRKTQEAQHSSPIAHLLRESYLGLMQAAVHLIEAKNPYLKDHSRRVADHSARCAQRLKFFENAIEVIVCAGMLHDIGKIGVSDVVLLKPGKLDAKEWQEIRTHPTLGSGLVEHLKLFRAEEPLIRHHHERFDGAGYPAGLRGAEIPIGAQIIALADAYDAMTSLRPYRMAMTPDTARKIIEENIGTQFDPAVAQAFLDTV